MTLSTVCYYRTGSLNSTMQMEVAILSIMLAALLMYQITCRHMTEDHHSKTHYQFTRACCLSPSKASWIQSAWWKRPQFNLMWVKYLDIFVEEGGLRKKLKTWK